MFYLLVAGWSPDVNAAILLGFAVLVFVPIRYVYPSRTPMLPRSRRTCSGVVWGMR